MKHTINISITLLILTILSSQAMATPAAPIFSDAGWRQFAQDDGVGKNGYVNPGYGGQAFDAEYFYYKINGNMLSIGLQSGFNLITGNQTFSGKQYWAGDIALSFDGNITNGKKYEYAIDFGLLTRDYQSHYMGTKTTTTSSYTTANGKHVSGVYQVGSWNAGGDIYYQVSNPFAMLTGTRKTDISVITGQGGTTSDHYYYEIATFDITKLGITSPVTMDAHWTMSCGNDAINGRAQVNVPEPGTLLLLGSGLLGAAVFRCRKR